VHQDAGWVWTILSDEDQQLGLRLELEQLDSEGRDWFADGPGGAEAGSLSDVLIAAAGANANADWINAVVAAIGRQLACGDRGSLLLVIRGDGVWYHATASRNRSSIQRHGLDWSRMVPPGIAGSHAPEMAGVFLCSDLEGAEWFAAMCRDATADIWSVTLRDMWLESAPAGGGGTHWMICPHQIPPSQIRLIRRDIPRGRG
jgi:hypothetical protein